MSDKAANRIALAIIVFSFAYALANRYSVVESHNASVIMSKDSWTGLVEICAPEKCFYH